MQLQTKVKLTPYKQLNAMRCQEKIQFFFLKSNENLTSIYPIETTVRLMELNSSSEGLKFFFLFEAPYTHI